MDLSSSLISEFVKATNDDTQKSSETTVNGTVTISNGTTYVKLDGSDLMTPVSTTTDVQNGERVTVLIKDHTAMVTGNISSPSARTGDVKDVKDAVSNLDTLVAKKADITELNAQNAKISDLEADNATINGTLKAQQAVIDDLDATYVKTETLEANYVKTATLEADYVKTKTLEANYTKTDTLEANYIKTATADIKYANIDFSNINEAAVKKIFSDSGIIKDLVVQDGNITGELVGVTIKGDLIEGNSIKADKLVVLGSDGLYYKLNVNALGETTASSDEKYQNGLDGSVIVAKSLTAEKVNVSDLVAFGATIGGFNITESSLYSGVKTTALNTTRGIYLDRDGQLSVGDASNYLRYYKADDGSYKLEISADSMIFRSGSGTTSVQDAIDTLESKVSTFTVKNTSVTYQVGTSGTVEPTGEWSSNIPAVSGGQYLWTKTVVTYSDGTTETSYLVSYNGNDGQTGSQGPKGDKGDTGEKGATGDKGEKGDTGATGSQGPKGDKGDTGATGSQGAKGDKGDKGDDGTTYYTWIKYADTPTSGMSDNPTDKKYIGIAANKTTLTESTSYSDYNWSLIKGDKGDTGDKGATGDKGDKGDKGDTGATGSQGAKGDTGATGNGIKSITYYYARTTSQTAPTASSITATSMPTLDSTNKYLWQKEVITYTSSSTQTTVLLLAVYGDKGATGAKGDTGAQGPQGEKGATGDKGDTGAKGDKGEKGDTGAKGDKGDIGDTGVSVVSTTRYYILVQTSQGDGTSKVGPDKPTTNPPSSDWVTTEPSYDNTKLLYFVDLTVFSDGSFSYSEVSQQAVYGYTVSLDGEISGAQSSIAQLQTAIEQKVSYQYDDNNQPIDVYAEIVNLGNQISSTVRVTNYSDPTDTTATKYIQTENGTYLIDASQLNADVNKTITDVAAITDQVAYVNTNVSDDNPYIEIGNPAKNDFKIKITEKEIDFMDEGTVVAYINNKKMFITDGQFTNSLQLGNFAFIPRSNGNLSFKKVTD